MMGRSLLEVGEMLYEVFRDGLYMGSFSSLDDARNYALTLEPPSVTIDIHICIAYVNRDGEYNERPSFRKWHNETGGVF